MAFQAFKGGLLLPHQPRVGNTAVSSILNGATDKWACVFRVPKSGTLDQFEFRGEKIVLDGASAVRLSFQNVNPADGLPDGVQDEFVDMATGDFVAGEWQRPPTVITDDGTVGGVKRSVTQGDLLSAVIEFQTFTALDDIRIKTLDAQTPKVEHVFPYFAADAGAGYVKGTRQPVLALKYSDGSFAELAPNIIPSVATAGISYNSGSSPDEIGIRFRVPFPIKVKGGWVLLDSFTGGALTDLVLYDSDGATVLATVNMDPDVSANNGVGVQFHYFNSEITLLANTYYRFVCKPTTTNGIILVQWTADVAALLDTLPGGQDFHRTHRTDGGAWSNDPVNRPLLGVYATAFDSGAAGGIGSDFFRGMVT